MSEPDLSTLPQRMRYAAEVRDEANARIGDWDGKRFGGSWLTYADMWEAQDRADSEKVAQSHALAEELWEAFLVDYHTDSITEKLKILGICRRLVDDGWKKD